LQSLRSAAALEHEGRAEVSEDFLAALGAKITLDIRDKPADARALELVNKTNQFSLNGQRFTEGEWQSYFAQEGAFLAVVSYEDRFGPLGKIAVAAGRRGPHGARIDAWVMSCRAFSRRIEHQTLRALLAFADGELRFAFRPTDRNGPLQEFLASIVEAPLTEGEIRLSPERFAVTCPALHHEVIEHIHG
jgi:FkbH-like protein